MFRDHPTSTVRSRVRAFAQSWTGAAAISVGIHALLFLLATAGLKPTVVRPPVDAYLAMPDDWNGATPDTAGRGDSVDGYQSALRPSPLARSASRDVHVEVDDVRIITRGAVLPRWTSEVAEAASNTSATALAQSPGSESMATPHRPSDPESSDPQSSDLEWRILQWLQRHRTYPRSALRAGLQGEVGVRFVLDRRGQLLHAEIVSSSGSRLLDQAALDLLRRAQPYPLPALDPGVDQLEMNLPMAYRIDPARS